MLRLGCLNIRSLAKKFHSLSDLITYKNIDVLSTTETCHDEGSLALSKLRQYGYLVLDLPRPREGLALRSLGTNHGGLAQLLPDYCNYCLQQLDYVSSMMVSIRNHFSH